MKNFKLTNLISKSLLKLTFVFTFLFASATVFTAVANTSLHAIDVVGNEPTEMIVIPSEEGTNEADVTLYSESAAATIIVFDTHGMVVLEEIFPVKKDQENSLTLDLNALKTGTYYVVHNESRKSVTYEIVQK